MSLDCWPTHRAKARARTWQHRHRTREPEPEQPSFDAIARSLVDRGLASRHIIEAHREKWNQK